ncbi:MAG TPA: hypothetical protein VMF13_15950 [Luteitalea sp.]|nr:hypothetical protein [Luteitalea sp.]
MQTAFALDDARLIARMTVSGTYVHEGVVALLERLQAERAWGYGVLFDMRTLDVQPTSADLARVTETIAGMSTEEKRGPLALLVREGEQYARACAYWALGKNRGRDIDIFRHPDEAEEWLREQLGTS